MNQILSCHRERRIQQCNTYSSIGIPCTPSLSMVYVCRVLCNGTRPRLSEWKPSGIPQITGFLYSHLWIFRYILHSRLQNFADTPPWNSQWSATRNQTQKYITETSFRASHVTACRTHCSGGCPNTADYAHRRNAALTTETVTGPKSFFTQVFLRLNIAFSSTHYHKPYCMSDCLQKRQFYENSSC
jgi:hypothetical protein